MDDISVLVIVGVILGVGLAYCCRGCYQSLQPKASSIK